MIRERLVAAPRALVSRWSSSRKPAGSPTREPAAVQPVPIPAGPASAGGHSAKPSAEAAILRHGGKAFIEAFNRGDADALAAMFTAHASVADDEGADPRGQTAIRDEYARLFKTYPGAKICRRQVGRVPHAGNGDRRRHEPGLGRSMPARRSSAATPPCHVLTDGKWLMASVREAKVAIPSNHCPRRKPRLAGRRLEGRTRRQGGRVEDPLDRQQELPGAGIQGPGRRHRAFPAASRSSAGTRPPARSAPGRSTPRADTAPVSGPPRPTAGRSRTPACCADGTPTASRDLLIRVPGEDDVFGWKSVARTAGRGLPARYARSRPRPDRREEIASIGLWIRASCVYKTILCNAF